MMPAFNKHVARPVIPGLYHGLPGTTLISFTGFDAPVPEAAVKVPRSAKWEQCPKAAPLTSAEGINK